jgi:hypothetical protein
MKSSSADESRVQESMLEVGSAVGTDFAYLVPADQRHFDPMTVVVAFGGILLSSFLHGFVDESKSSADEAGRHAARWLRARLASLFTPDANEASATAAEDLKAAVQEAAAIRPTDPANIEKYAYAAARALEEELLKEGMPAERATALVAKVRVEAAQLAGLPLA